MGVIIVDFGRDRCPACRRIVDARTIVWCRFTGVRVCTKCAVRLPYGYCARDMYQWLHIPHWLGGEWTWHC